jgi:hypothetical protein
LCWVQKRISSEWVLTSGPVKLFLGVPQKVRERRAPGGGVYPEAEPREGGWKEETTKWTGNGKHIGACSGVSEVRVWENGSEDAIRVYNQEPVEGDE